MEEVFKKIKYLQCDPKYRVDKQSLEKVIALIRESGLPTSQLQPKEILQGEELNELLSGNELLISACRPIMTKVFDSFTDKTKLLFLCDTKGYIIDFLSSPEIMQWCFNRGIMLGSCLDYYSFGTNSISMAIFQDSPIVIIGDEHYCDIMKSWSCIAAPVKLNGRTVGFIDISAEVNSDLVQLIALVELMAELTGSCLKMMNEKCKEMGDNCHTEGEVFNPSAKNAEVEDIGRVNKSLFFGKVILAGSDLTIREVEVLYELYCGKGHDRIFSELNISKNTFKSHVKSIYHKLGVNNFKDCVSKVENIVLG